MQVTIEDLSAVKKLLHIEVPEENITLEIDKAYKKLKKTATVKGFRPGKAPRSVLERIYKNDVEGDVISKVIQESFFAAIQEKELKLIGRPGIEPPELEANAPYKFSATIEVAPELEDVDFKGLKLKKTVYKVTSKEEDAQLKMLQKNLAKQEPVKEDRAVEDGDYVLVDYEGYKDGEAFEETSKTENFSMKIGEGRVSKELDDGIIGMKKEEEKEIIVKFPEDYFNKSLADTEINFKVKLNEIREEVLPEINDEFAKNFGKFENIEDLKKEITKNLEEGYEKRTEQEVHEQIFKLLLEKDFEVPDAMIEYELDNIMAEAERSFAYRNMSMEDLGLTRESIGEKYRETAENQVKRQVLLSKLIEQEKLEVSDEELEIGMKDLADKMNYPLEEIKKHYKQDKNKLEHLKQSLLERQALKMILESADIEEVKAEEKSEEDKNE
ncbi:MAG: trigger factor [Desulfobacterales bacterium]|nr:trigger factor [Desulfobacterales bacterium]